MRHLPNCKTTILINKNISGRPPFTSVRHVNHVTNFDFNRVGKGAACSQLPALYRHLTNEPLRMSRRTLRDNYRVISHFQLPYLRLPFFPSFRHPSIRHRHHYRHRHRHRQSAKTRPNLYNQITLQANPPLSSLSSSSPFPNISRLPTPLPIIRSDSHVHARSIRTSG